MDGDVQDYTIDSFLADTLVMVQHLTEQEKRFLRVGDVISYHSGGMLKQHRIVDIRNRWEYSLQYFAII